ncbi:hypothetical protein HOD30_01945 [Candidatus Peregrinibacteria bacterium]|jgi:hypothetical protein|nr:hypothetical protein [Candidatus Peregrinibacteria bacterium]MBT4631780.1 hypothetical protein [Candidatus Peregrinibacteria bacterium]MBT5516843.1 hypothetical protein [Candidatus Peregrinibacteria bacterium]MBT5824495.1 hypothetical protein [Candidatus Peregrinibacteria bacterium]
MAKRKAPSKAARRRKRERQSAAEAARKAAAGRKEAPAPEVPGREEIATRVNATLDGDMDAMLEVEPAQEPTDRERRAAKRKRAAFRRAEREKILSSVPPFERWLYEVVENLHRMTPLDD